MNTLPPINYDARLESRVTVLEINEGEQLGHRPDWLASPLKQQLIQGASGVLQRSQFIERRPNVAASVAAAAALEPSAREAAAVAAAAIAEAASDSSNHSFAEDDGEMQGAESPMAARVVELADDSDLDDGSDESLPATRKRKAPDTFLPGGASPKHSKVTKVAKGKAAAKCIATKSSDVINPRSKMPYKRGGPYNRPRVETVSKPSKACVPAEKSDSIATLRAELAAAKNKIVQFEMQLELEKRTVAAQVLSAKNEMLAKMSSDAMEHFMRGLNHGSRLSGGIGIMSHMPSPFSAASGSGS